MPIGSRQLRLPLALIALGLVAGCSDGPADPSQAAASNAQRSAAVARHEGPHYLPRGTKVPVGEVLKGDILPYDPAIDGPGTTPPTSVAAIRNTQAIPRTIPTHHGMQFVTAARGLGGRTPPPTPADGHTDVHRGWWLYAGRGVYARNDAHPDITIPYGFDNRSVLYAPTTLPPGGSCWEVTTVHWVGSLHGTANSVIGLWDWCNALTFTHYYDLTPGSSFSSNYVRSQVDEWGYSHAVYFLIVTPSNFALNPTDSDCWTVKFYNFNTGTYDNMAQSCGVTQIVAQGGDPAMGTGWTMHESNGLADHYSTLGCARLPAIDVGQVSLYVYQGGVVLQPGAKDDPSYWGELNVSVPNDCFSQGLWTFEENPSYPNYWFAWTPSTN